MRFAVAVYLAVTLPAALAAQNIRGTVRGADDVAVPGVVLELLDANAAVLSRTLSDERGEFRFGVARSGEYVIRSLRIGFRPALQRVAVQPNEDVRVDIRLATVRVSLEAIRVTGRNPCTRISGVESATVLIWEQVRTALTATSLSARNRAMTARTVVYERTLDPDRGAILTQQASASTQLVTRAWNAMSPDSLRRLGFVRELQDFSTIYYAPGIEFLLSPEFMEDYCFRFQGDPAADIIGIAFEPTPDRRRIAAIRGMIWIERRTAELQALDFTYANVRYEIAQGARGRLEFRPMRNGLWAITRWSLRMPVLEFPIAAPGIPRVDGDRKDRFVHNRSVDDLKTAEIAEIGGELALATRGQDTLWKGDPAVLRGLILDSTSRRPVAGARISLAGTSERTVSDRRGQFTIGGLIPGTYRIEVQTPSLDSVGAAHEFVVTVSTADVPSTVRVPRASEHALAYCSMARFDLRARRFSAIAGAVSVREDSTAAAKVRVLAEWTVRRTDPNGVSRDTLRSTEARTDARGAFVLCGVPNNVPIVVRAIADSASGAHDVAADTVVLPQRERVHRSRLWVSAASLQHATIAGFVLSDSASAPVAGVDIRFPDLRLSATTDSTGAFRVTRILPGVQRITIRRLGFAPYDAELVFARAGAVSRDFVLTRR